MKQLNAENECFLVVFSVVIAFNEFHFFAGFTCMLYNHSKHVNHDMEVELLNIRVCVNLIYEKLLILPCCTLIFWFGRRIGAESSYNIYFRCQYLFNSKNNYALLKHSRLSLFVFICHYPDMVW